MTEPPTRTERIARRVAAHERAALTAVLLLGLLIRLPFIASDQGIIGDPAIFVEWAGYLRSGGPAELIGETGSMVLYPPISTLAIWTAGVAGGFGDGPSPSTSGATLAMLKGLAIAGDLGLGWLVARLLAPRGALVRVVGAAAIVLNPAFWYLSTLWGQIDSVSVLLMVAAIAALAAGHVNMAWAGWAGSVLWKLTAVTIAPVMAVGTVRAAGWRAGAIGVLSGIVVALAAGVILLRDGGWAGYAARLWPPGTELDVSAFNAWYLVGAGHPWGGDLVPWLSASAGSIIAWLLVGGITICVGAAMWRRPNAVGLALPAAVSTLAVFVCFTGMHERYLLAAIPFLVLVAGGWEGRRADRPAFVAFVAISATQTLNLIAVGSFAPSLWVNIFANVPNGPLAPPIVALGYAAAAANLAVLGWALRRVVRRAWVVEGELPASAGQR